MNLGQLQIEVSNIVRRGNTLADTIAGEARRAGRWLELNYDFAHMQRLQTFDVTGTETTYVEMGLTAEVKKFEGFRYLASSEYVYPVQQSLKDQMDRVVGNPTAYYKIGSETKVRWNRDVVPELSMDALVYEFSTWPTAPEITLPLFALEGLLIYNTVARVATVMRDDKLLSTYAALSEMELKATLLWQDEALAGNRADFFGMVVA